MEPNRYFTFKMNSIVSESFTGAYCPEIQSKLAASDMLKAQNRSWADIMQDMTCLMMNGGLTSSNNRTVAR